VRQNQELEKNFLHAKQEIVQLKNKDMNRKENLAKYREENKAVQEDDAARRQQKNRADAGKRNGTERNGMDRNGSCFSSWLTSCSFGASPTLERSYPRFHETLLVPSRG
jgi:sRNA-binding protein